MQQSSFGGDSDLKKEMKFGQKAVASSIVSYLEDFGLTTKEAEIYYVLSRLGQASANEISNVAKYNRLQTYRSVKGLLDRGLVEISLERPRKYTPLKIEQTINLLEKEAANKLIQLENKKPLLLQKWSEITDSPIPQNCCTFRIIQGNKNVLRFTSMFLDSAQKKIDIAIKGSEINRLMIEDTDGSLQEKTSKRVKIRVISEFVEHNSSTMQRLMEFCELRHISSLDTVPIALVDCKEILICLNGNTQGLPENAIWTNHPEFVSMLTSFYNSLWLNAEHKKHLDTFESAYCKDPNLL
jgi:sugar-specific transcriptional regulator TrmB